MGIDSRLVVERCAQLGITDKEFFDATGVFPAEMEQDTQSGQVSVDVLTRIAELLHLLPSDLIADLPSRSALDLADLMLVEFAVANAPHLHDGLRRLLGWTPYRLGLTLALLRILPTSATHRLGTMDEWWLILEPTEDRAHPHDREEYATWFAARIAPDPFDAIALLRVLRVWLWQPVGLHAAFASPALLERLASRHLAVAADTRARAPRMLAENGVEVPVQPHPDLLFALGLGEPPDDTRRLYDASQLVAVNWPP